MVFLSKLYEGELLEYFNFEEDLEGFIEGNLWIGGNVVLIQ